MASGNRKTPAKKPAAKSAAARKPANRRTTADAGPPSLSLAHVQGFGVGAAVGVILGAAGVTWLAQEGMPKADSTAEPARLEQDSEPEPRFDFYTVLPSQNLDLTSDITPLTQRSRAPATFMSCRPGRSEAARMQIDAGESWHCWVWKRL